MNLEITKFTTGGTIQPGQPVILFLHGYGADEKDLPDLMSYLPNLPWLSPRAPLQSEYSGFAWYHITNALNPTESDVLDVTESLWNWINQEVPETSQLILIGFSQGALMATQLLRTHPERIMATVILSGFIYSGELSGDKTLESSKPKVIYCRGLEDPLITKEVISRLNSWLQTHTRATTKTYPNLGHSVDGRVMADVSNYLEGILGEL